MVHDDPHAVRQGCLTDFRESAQEQVHEQGQAADVSLVR